MKVFNAVLAAVCVTVALSVQMALAHPSWTEYKQLYNKAFTPAEDAKREKIYNDNMKVADSLAAKNPLATFGHNAFAHLSAEEFKVYHNADKAYKTQAQRARFAPKKSFGVPVSANPQSVDWRAKGAVTYVKNQGQCGSCWSFSTTGSTEGQWFLAGHTLVALSEQELVSCDTNDDGCNGGLMDNAWTTVVNSWGGFMTGENDYPYVSGEGQVPACARTGKPARAHITGYVNVATSEAEMVTALATVGPLSIAVDASTWQTYTGGIMTNCASTQVDHGVLAVGYNLEYSTPYWIIKNSWANSWGEDGYIRVQYGTDQCLITYAPGYPIASKGVLPPPSPTSPATPAPPTPPTPPASGTFTQYQCQNGLCLGNCTSNSFPQGQCLSLTGGGSAIATCSTSSLNLQVFSASTDCTGASQTDAQPLNECLQDTSGTYIYNTCSGSSSGSSSGSGSGSNGAAMRAAKIASKPQLKMANKKKQ